MPCVGRAAAGRREHALALDLDHAGAAVAVGRDSRPCSRGAGSRRRGASPTCDDRLAASGRRRPRRSSLKSIGCASFMLRAGRSSRSAFTPTSCGKYFMHAATGFGAAWPRPQIEASRIACDSSSSSGSSHCGASISCDRLRGADAARRALAAVLVARRTASGCSAASRAVSCCDSTITAAEPMKQPCGCSVSKSSGMSAIEAGRMPPDAPPGR